MLNCVSYFSEFFEVLLITLTIFGESQGESQEGKIGVGNVIYKRHIESNKSFSDICLSKKQFSYFNNNGSRIERDKRVFSKSCVKQKVKTIKIFIRCYNIAKTVSNGSIKDNTNGSTYYHAKTYKNRILMPLWAKSDKLEKTVIIGNHIFYKRKG